MRSRHLIGLVPLLAVMAFALTPAVAQAVQVPTYWYSNGEPIPEGVQVPIVSSSPALTLTDTGPGFPGVDITCEEHNEGYVENPVGGGGGVDSITSVTYENCISNACPYPAETGNTPIPTGPIYEEAGSFFDPSGPLTGSVDVCGVDLGYEGTAAGEWVNGDPSTVVFNNTPGLTLENGDVAVLTGTITMEGTELGDEVITMAPPKKFASWGSDGDELVGELPIEVKSGVSKLYLKGPKIEVRCTSDTGKGTLEQAANKPGRNKNLNVMFAGCKLFELEGGKEEYEGCEVEMEMKGLESVLAYVPGTKIVVDALMNGGAVFQVRTNKPCETKGKKVAKGPYEPTGSVIGQCKIQDKEAGTLNLLFDVNGTLAQEIREYEEEAGSKVKTPDTMTWAGAEASFEGRESLTVVGGGNFSCNS